MENKINVAELLKHCPEGTELSCTMYDNLYFESCQSDCYDTTIRCYTLIGGIKTIIIFTKYGTFNKHNGAKCVIFPKGKTSWDGFVPSCKFKDGDVVADNGGWVGITAGGERNRFIPTYCVIRGVDGGFEVSNERKERYYFDRLASENEKERLFKAIKDNGYKWNAEKKTLEKLIEPKFKVGDRIKHVVGREEVATVTGVEVTHYNLDSKVGTSSFTISLQHEWELIPNKFDITTLKPYKSEVLFRNSQGGYWKPAFWGAYIPENSEKHGNHNFLTTEGFAHYCIPYKGNEHLLGKQGDCDDFYKIWE